MQISEPETMLPDSGQVPRVLVVDDELTVLRTFERFLAGEGISLVYRMNADDAMVEFHRKSFSLVFLDVRLAGRNGLEVAQEMLKVRPRVPIILISGYGSVADAVSATKMGVYDYLEKPINRTRLLEKLYGAMDLAGRIEAGKVSDVDTLSRYGMIGQSAAMLRVYDFIDRVGSKNMPILIEGEHGVGKELVAGALHQRASKDKPMVKINCAAIPGPLLESELFGYERGAFTGADRPKQGRVELAAESTLFLDEIGEMEESAQVKILRFIEYGELQKLGSRETVRVSARVIAATNRDLEQAIANNSFRSDLYYRINRLKIKVPPLRERPEDIIPLLNHFIATIADTHGLSRPVLTPAAQQNLRHYQWPGNIRQLKNFVERVLVLDFGPQIDVEHVARNLEGSPALVPWQQRATEMDLKQARQEFEKNYIRAALVKTGGKLKRTAQLLGIDRANLYRKMKRYGIRAEEAREAEMKLRD